RTSRRARPPGVRVEAVKLPARSIERPRRAERRGSAEGGCAAIAAPEPLGAPVPHPAHLAAAVPHPARPTAAVPRPAPPASAVPHPTHAATPEAAIAAVEAAAPSEAAAPEAAGGGGRRGQDEGQTGAEREDQQVAGHCGLLVVLGEVG